MTLRWTVAVTMKSLLYSGTNVMTFLTIDPNSLPEAVIQPVVSFDEPPRGGYAWFIAKPHNAGGTPYQGGPLACRRLQWSVTNASWTDKSWLYFTNSAFRDYFDLDDGAVTAPQADTSLRLDLYTVGSRLGSAVMRDGAIWTSHHIGLSGTNGSYNGDETGTTVDRTAAQWLKVQMDTNGNFLSITNGRVYDSSSSDPRWYYFPSLMVNKAGDMVMGFSGAKATEFIGAYYSWRSAAGAVAPQPECLAPGQGPVEQVRWGDYSHTTLDPSDSLGFWTAQEYSGPDFFTEAWGTWIGQIVVPFQ